MRIVGLDVGERRIGIAISDATRTLARPVHVVRPRGLEQDAPQLVAETIDRLAADGDGIETIVVGLPRRLDGSPTEMTTRVMTFADTLRQLVDRTVVLQDERLTSREAEARLAVTDKNWRSRKQRLDAAAAAIILQDYLDTRPGRPAPVGVDPEV